jgi:hypothetical protein
MFFEVNCPRRPEKDELGWSLGQFLQVSHINVTHIVVLIFNSSESNETKFKKKEENCRLIQSDLSAGTSAFWYKSILKKYLPSKVKGKCLCKIDSWDTI